MESRIRTNLLIPPATAGLAYQEDRSELGGASPLDGDAMLAACLADLNRQFPAWLWSSSVADAPDAYHPGDAQAQITPSYSALLDSLFTTAPCHGVFQSVLSVAGFTKHAAGARHAFRALQMWLEAHTFVASAGTQTNDVMETLLAADFASNPETPLPDGEAIDWDRLLDTLESGWWLILHPQVFGFLSSTTIDGYLVAPDYRAEWVQAWHPVFEDADKDPHTAGLAVTILDYAVAHLEADLRFLESVSAELVGAAAGSIEGERSAALARHGEILRYSWLAEALARDIVRRATVANGNTAPPWAPRWEDARVRLGAARDRALAAGSGLAHGQNPLGIEDADLPIYFVDPQGANSRFFAISDYLLTGWARPAVSAAQAALASAREAWLAKRHSEIRARLELEERERRLELIRARYGQVLVDGCGLQMPAEDALTAFEQNVYRIADCSEIQSPQCRSRAEEAIARSQPPASTCPGVSPVWSDPHELYMTRRQICVMARDWAIVTADPSTKKSFMRNWQLLIPPYTSSGWFDPQVDPLIDIMELRVFPLAQTFSGDPGLVPTGVLTANASGGGAFQVPTAWPRLDNLFTEQCGSVLFSITPETTVTFSNLGGQNHQEAVRTWYEAYQKSYRFRKQEHFGAAMDRKIQVLEAWCDDYLMSRADALGGEPHFYDPSALASCYRGELGSTAAEILTANDHVHVALTELRGLERRYETAVRTCLSRSAADETIVAANDRLAVALEELRQLGASASIVTGAVQGIIGGLASENPVSLLGTVFGLGLSSTRERMEKKAAALERNHALMVGLLQAKVGLESCLAEASNVRSAIDTQVAAITVALDNVVQALIRRSNLMTSMENALSDGLAALRREEGRDTTNPGFHYWLDERVETFRREFDWARRLSYMALRALEYEAQSSLPIRHWILGARHPDELAIALREVEREQATRGIDGARPEAGTVVLSTVRDLLGLSDSFNAQLGYGRESARDRLRNKLADGASDVFDERGRYLGKAIDFEVRPEGPLQYRCAERLWSVTAAVEGDLLGARTPTLPLYVLKRNHFASQWCGARGGGEAMQTASVRPTRNLFRGADGSVTQEVVETSTWASVDAWINVKRSELYRDEYRQGSSDELAGRGLYGAYTLILPADGFLDEVSSLTGLEDILIRFDYVSVANPTALVSDPPTIDPVVDEALPRVTDLTAAPSEGRCSLTWTNPADPRLASVRVLGKAGGFPTGPTDAAATVVYEGLTTNASWTTWSWSTQSPIANESYIAAYAHYGGTSYSAPTRGTGLPFFFDYDAGDLSHSHETFEATPTAWNLAVSGDDMDWTRQTGATSSASTGPDGASQGAWYAYIEASSPNFPNKTSITDVTVASLPTERWISFSWHMYGATIGTLELQYHNGTSWVTVWSKSGDQGNAWFTEGVRLTGYGGSSLSLRFRSVTGTSFTGDTAIDDIRIFGAP
ncbi:MAG: hypothetical protein IT385_27260 [Deltaproteobacteria bacterium]|nr:hypothetical protein [Deltaproteobacteria bacterium]